jgi:hypothetical protein
MEYLNALLQALVKPVFEPAGHVTYGIDSGDSRSHNQAEVGRGLGALAAVLTWLGWLTISPALGFPILGAAGMINRALYFRNIPEAGHNPDFWLGWVLVVSGLVIAAAVFFFVVERAPTFGPGIRAGVIYGALLWLVAGFVFMPLLAFIEPSTSVSAAGPGLQPFERMYPTVMMYSSGLLAPVAALIAWVLFGAILGATGRARQ